jgi:hypothetical protein
MIINKHIPIKMSPANINYWKNKNYVTSVGQNILVKLDDIPEKSNIMIECKCDECHRNYSQRRYRNLNVCGYCISKKRMLGNNLGHKNVKHICGDLILLRNMIEDGQGKQYLANIFSVNIGTINRWLKENGMKVSSYQGSNYFKNDSDKIDAIENIRNLSSLSKTISEIVNETHIPIQVVKNIVSNYNIKISNRFQIWKDQYDIIRNNMNFYIEENGSKTLNEISNEYGLSLEQLKKAFKECNVNPKIHSYNKSKGEIECRDFIRSLGLVCDSYRFDKTYEIDCYVSSKNFGIEYCGEYWHRYDPNVKRKTYHKDKVKFFSEKNIKLMTIFENEWKNNKDLLKSMIRTRLGMVHHRTYARNCEVRKIDKAEADVFHLNNHISGKTTSSINYGLYDKNNNLQTVLSFIKSRFDKNYEYEISRFSTLRDNIVVGGLSKMFKYFIKDADPKSCMTYSDLRFGEGKSYEKAGFTLLGETSPNYHYYHNKVGIMENRMKYQKSKLSGMPEYDKNKTEFEIMKLAGYYIIYDCGSKKYGWRR